MGWRLDNRKTILVLRLLQKYENNRLCHSEQRDDRRRRVQGDNGVMVSLSNHGFPFTQESTCRQVSTKEHENCVIVTPAKAGVQKLYSLDSVSSTE